MAETFVGKIEGGAIKSKVLKSWLKDREGLFAQIDMKQIGNKRSDRQNAYYFGVIVPATRKIFEDNGETISCEDAHQFLKKEVGGFSKIITAPDGTFSEIIESSTIRDKKEWELWMEKCRVFCAENHRPVGLPREVL